VRRDQQARTAHFTLKSTFKPFCELEAGSPSEGEAWHATAATWLLVEFRCSWWGGHVPAGAFCRTTRVHLRITTSQASAQATLPCCSPRYFAVIRWYRTLSGARNMLKTTIMPSQARYASSPRPHHVRLVSTMQGYGRHSTPAGRLYPSCGCA
jgi:hypothetical protein